MKLRARSLSPSKRYSKLLRILSQKDTKVVVSLGGGGVRIFAHPSALRFLESIGADKYITEIWGSGGGAIIGLLYSVGLPPTRIEEEGDKFFHSKNGSKIIPSFLSIAKRLVTEKFISEADAYIDKGFHDIQLVLQGLVSEALKRQKQRYPFYCLALNIETSQTDVLTPMRVPDNSYPGWIFQTNPLDAVVASSALPIVFVPKVIEDRHGKRIYADGALIEEVPTVSIYRKWLRDKELGIEKKKRLLIIGVNLNPPYFSSLGFLKNWLIQKLPGFQYMLMSMRCADYMRKARTEAQKKVVVEDPNVEMWDINLGLGGGGFLNVDLIPKVIQTAQNTFPNQFSKINNSLIV